MLDIIDNLGFPSGGLKGGIEIMPQYLESLVAS
jgi:hypothetical protein